MTGYELNSSSAIIRYSLDELQEISHYLMEKEDFKHPVTVLVGGWAVDSYNPWFGSVDIDLITNSSTRQSLSYYLRDQRGFMPYRLTGLPTSVKKETEAGAIIIDFATKQKPFPFEGTDADLDFNILEGNTELREIRGGTEIAVPNRATLLVLKLKAIWDRSYRIEKQLSADLEWETGKLIKDHADILALIDPEHGGNQIDISVLGKLMEKYPFLKESLISVYNSNEGVEKYNRISYGDARIIIDRTISLIS
ncbi:hypothetical protein HWN40_08100 [Methanolobus zinderi]|uniref:Nucleotidyltransferase family protein n=1 Tax=Methanolobus zinderi TaxID=536044 RepID=A0A7D5I5A5_9EURY|nr:hypothetical protein [Methanolobus zinderi]QLC50203.1 hypothetical protein HWN40_08100 [Methanolobus zinderi]